MTQPSFYLLVVVPRDSALLQVFSSALREPHDVARAHGIHAVHTRIAPCRCRASGGCEMLVHRGSAKHRVPVLEPHRISREHPRRTLLILVHVVSVEERVPEPILFGLPSCSLKRRTCPHALPSAPFNARCDGYGCGCGCRFHGSPPLLDRPSAECAARLPRRPLLWRSQGHVPVTLQEHPCVIAKRMPGDHHIVSSAGVLDVPSSCRGSMARPETPSGSLSKAE